ncbi:hypothetical protein, partial [Xanthomonas nasturtii]|uniref:hypothetical protein n=1 Tax=Xanthomonas nasturtii TaxID=1843581 RepID=UPI002B22CA54
MHFCTGSINCATSLRTAALFKHRNNERGESETPKGVDETEKPAMMGGSLHGKTLRRIEVQRRQLPLHEGLTEM